MPAVTVLFLVSSRLRLHLRMQHSSLKTSHNPSEIILICSFTAQETFLIIINVKNCFAA